MDTRVKSLRFRFNHNHGDGGETRGADSFVNPRYSQITRFPSFSRDVVQKERIGHLFPIFLIAFVQPKMFGCLDKLNNTTRLMITLILHAVPHYRTIRTRLHRGNCKRVLVENWSVS